MKLFIFYIYLLVFARCFSHKVCGWITRQTILAILTLGDGGGMKTSRRPCLGLSMASRHNVTRSRWNPLQALGSNGPGSACSVCDLGWLLRPFWLAVPWYLNGGHGKTWGWHLADTHHRAACQGPLSAPTPGSAAGRSSADASVVVTRWYVRVCSKLWGHSEHFRNYVSHSAWKGLVLHLQAVLQYSLFCLSWGFGGYVNKTKQKSARKFKRKPRKYSERSVGWPLHQPWWSSTSAPVELWAWLRVWACIAQDACPEAPSGPCQWPALRLEWGSSRLRIQGVCECKADESFSFTDL